MPTEPEDASLDPESTEMLELAERARDKDAEDRRDETPPAADPSPSR